MATLRTDPDCPPLTPAQSLAGCRLEFCVELLGEGAARIFVRAVEQSSMKATELHRGVLFQRLGARFKDLAGCVEFLHADLAGLVDTARRVRPGQDNLFATVEYSRTAWERVQQGLDLWARR